MLRPKRSAAQKVKQKQEQRESDDELNLSEESDGDFSSASSDEYDPTKGKENEETFEESEEDVSESDSEEAESENSPEKPNKTQRSRGNRSIISTLRGTHGNKFKRKSSGGNLQEILQRAQYQKKRSVFGDTADEVKEKAPRFDCSGGLRLSDSSGSDDEDQEKSQNAKERTLALIDKINQASGATMVDLKSVHDNYQHIENAKAKLLSYKQAGSGNQKEDLNIADLLALGEGPSKSKSSTSKNSSQKRKAQNDDSDSDGWEAVEEDETAAYKIPKHGVEITLNNFNDNNSKKPEKKVDLEAQMKRKLNRRRKEFQVYLHKVNLIAWVAHGNFLNPKLNDTQLMASALKLLPKNKNHCYPTDKTDMDYFKQITNWFKSTISLNNKDMYCFLKRRPPVMMSLALQIKFKGAICRRDYVLIFVILLRALGIQCRVVQSLNCAPMFPPKSELLSLATKPQTKTVTSSSKGSKASCKKSKTKVPSSSQKSVERNSRSKSKKSITIPQMDGGNDLPRGAKKPLKLKALPGYEVDESFVNLNNDERKKPKRTKVGETSSNSKSTGENSAAVTKMAPQVKFSLDSPNRAKSPSEKLFKVNKQAKKVQNEEASKEVSPRKTRSKGKDEPEKDPKIGAKKTSSKFAEVSQKQGVDKPKEYLKVFSPRRLRSRSRSNEEETSKFSETGIEPSKSSAVKPNLKTLLRSNDRKRLSTANTDIDTAKKAKLESNKRSAEMSVNSKDHKKLKIDDEDSKYFKKSSLKKSSQPSATTSPVDRRVLSSDDDENANSAQLPKARDNKRIDIWVEVYSEKDERWLSIDVFKNKVDCVSEIIKTATHPMIYVFAWNNDNSLKDVSHRYCPNLNTVTRKLRVAPNYLESVIGQFSGNKTERDVKEDEELNKLQFKVPLPTTISQFKNHPLYALKRHLLKYEAIYPAEPPILGYIREEAIYPRECVFVLHTRETWLKEARVVKLNEVPYKMSKTLNWDNVTKKLLKDIPQELFGIWQTKDFEPPVARDGIVPRNAYGNVELFKPCMLPKGTVHLQLPGLNKVCKKIGVDCSQAITGFDSNGGWPYPVYDGFIVCQEFEEKVLDAWNREQEELERKETEKYEKRVYGNWKKLLKGLLIRERLKRKYNFEGAKEQDMI